MTEIDKSLTKGLQEGFAGRTERTQIYRDGIFAMESRHLETNEIIYHDEWAADRVGGGQELILVTPERDPEVVNAQYTRLYAGGVLDANKLSKLGVTKKDIITHLKSKILELGDTTRLHADCPEQVDGDWSYRYKIIEKIAELPLTVGRESIVFKGREVFVHFFLLSPVE